MGLEEQLHAFHIFHRVQKVILLLHHAGEKSHIVFALAQHIGDEVAGIFHNFPFRVSDLLIGFQKPIIVLLFFLKSIQHKMDQPILVGRNVHCAEVIPKEVNALSHQVFRGGNPAGHDCLINFVLFAQIIYQPALILAHNRAAVFNRDFLLGNEPGNQRGNVDFPPAVGDRAVSALHIPHRGSEHLRVLQFQPLADFVQSVLVV